MHTAGDIAQAGPYGLFNLAWELSGRPSHFHSACTAVCLHAQREHHNLVTVLLIKGWTIPR